MLGLYIEANLENVGKISFPDDYEWHFDVKCTHCGEVRSNVVFNPHDKYSLPDSRGEANLVMKCKLCERGCSASFDGPIRAYVNNEEDDKQKPRQLIATFDIRGLELVAFHPSDGVDVTSTSGALYEKVSVDYTPHQTTTEDDYLWSEYDEKLGEPVSISSFKSEFKKEKGK